MAAMGRESHMELSPIFHGASGAVPAPLPAHTRLSADQALVSPLTFRNRSGNHFNQSRCVVSAGALASYSQLNETESDHTF
jgi:hypothetical protein